MAIKYAMHRQDYDNLKSMLPERELQHATLDDAKLYYRESYNNMMAFLKSMGLNISIDFGYASRKDNLIEVDSGKGAALSYQFYSSSDSIIGSLTRISDKNNSKQSDIDVDDPELKYRKSSSTQSQRDSPVVKTRYNPFSKKDEIIKDTTIVTKDDYNKWQSDDDLPF